MILAHLKCEEMFSDSPISLVGCHCVITLPCPTGTAHARASGIRGKASEGDDFACRIDPREGCTLMTGESSSPVMISEGR